MSTADSFYLIGSNPRHSHILYIFPYRTNGGYELSKALFNVDSAHADCCSLPHPWLRTHNTERKDLDDPWSWSRRGRIGNNRCDGVLRKPDSCRMQRGLTRVMVPLLVLEFASPSYLTNCVDGTVATAGVRCRRYTDLCHLTGNTRDRHCIGTKQPGCVNDLHFRPPWPHPHVRCYSWQMTASWRWDGSVGTFPSPVLVQRQTRGLLRVALPREGRNIAWSSRVRFWCDVHSLLHSPTASA